MLNEKNREVPERSANKLLEDTQLSILCSLYKKDPEVPGNEEQTKFNIELNQKIVEHFKKTFGVEFNADKMRSIDSFILNEENLMSEDKNIYLAAAKSVCEAL